MTVASIDAVRRHPCNPPPTPLQSCWLLMSCRDFQVLQGTVSSRGAKHMHLYCRSMHTGVSKICYCRWHDERRLMCVSLYRPLSRLDSSSDPAETIQALQMKLAEPAACLVSKGCCNNSPATCQLNHQPSSQSASRPGLTQPTAK